MEKRRSHLIKVIATDMDGTLLSSEQTISKENFEAIEAARAAGVHVLIATGRSPREARDFLSKWQIKCAIICGNGAVVMDEEDQVISKNCLEMPQLTTAVRTLASHNFYLEVYTNHGNFTRDYRQQPYQDEMVKLLVGTGRRENKEAVLAHADERLALGILSLVDSNEDILQLEADQYEFYKVFAIHKDDRVFKEARAELEADPDLVVTTSWHDNIEVNAARATKGKALGEYVKSLGVGLEHSMAIGDSYNDLSMLEAAGFSVAMGNADDAIKDVCDFVTISNDEHGFAKAVYEVLARNKQAEKAMQ